MNNNITSLPGAFPLHEDKDYITESEWVIWKLLCRPLDTLPQSTPQELSQATGGQISEARCDELIRIANIATLTGLGTWIARLLAETGYDIDDVCDKPADVLLGSVNKRLGYNICNEATIRAFEKLQLQWRGEEKTRQAEKMEQS